MTQQDNFGVTIGRLAARAGVGKETIRYYQRRGLIGGARRRTAGGYGVYEPQVLERLRFIRHAQEIGFSLREIKQLEHEPGANSVRPEGKRSNAMKQVTLKVEGMHCEGCAQVMEALLAREDGVYKVAVSYAKREARVLLDPAATGAGKLAAAVERVGYRLAESEA